MSVTEDMVTINKEVDGVKIDEILNPDFMKEYTNFDNFMALTFSSLVWIDWNQDVVVTRKSLLDRFISGSSTFSTWDEMYEKAQEKYLEKQT